MPEHHRRTSLTESITSFRNLRAPLLRAALEEVTLTLTLTLTLTSCKGLACITSVVGCFLFAWFICGLVRPRRFEQLELGLG